MNSPGNKTLTKTTNHGFQIRKPPKTTAEQEKALREQLHAEIETKTKACSNIVYDCSLPRLQGFEYCLKHILQDPKAPYKQCTYLYGTNGKRCCQPAPKYDPKRDVFTNFCFEHSRQTQLSKTKLNVGKFKKIETNETLLKELSHHVNPIDATATATTTANNNLSSSYIDSGGDSDLDISKPFVDLYVDIDKIQATKERHILDYASDSSEDIDTNIKAVSNAWKGQDMDCSDNESIDSQNDDMLKHAGIYTTEEATMITKQKMMRLQSLYVEQIGRLHYLLKEKRRQYLRDSKLEQEIYGSLAANVLMKKKPIYDKFKALNKFHKRAGIESILHKKFLEKRAKISTTHRLPFHSRCIFSEGGVKCGEHIVPCSKYCRKHILEDKKQVLYRSCDMDKGGVICQQPVPNIFENATCVLHIEYPPQRSYIQRKFESDTEEDEHAIKEEKFNISPSSLTQMENLTSSIMSTTDSTKIEDVTEQFCSEDLGNNVTICHEHESSMEENILRLDESENSQNTSPIPTVSN